MYTRMLQPKRASSYTTVNKDLTWIVPAAPKAPPLAAWHGGGVAIGRLEFILIFWKGKAGPQRGPKKPPTAHKKTGNSDVRSQEHRRPYRRITPRACVGLPAATHKRHYQITASLVF